MIITTKLLSPVGDISSNNYQDGLTPGRATEARNYTVPSSLQLGSPPYQYYPARGGPPVDPTQPAWVNIILRITVVAPLPVPSPCRYWFLYSIKGPVGGVPQFPTFPTEVYHGMVELPGGASFTIPWNNGTELILKGVVCSQYTDFTLKVNETFSQVLTIDFTPFIADITPTDISGVATQFSLTWPATQNQYPPYTNAQSGAGAQGPGA